MTKDEIEVMELFESSVEYSGNFLLKKFRIGDKSEEVRAGILEQILLSLKGQNRVQYVGQDDGKVPATFLPISPAYYKFCASLWQRTKK